MEIVKPPVGAGPEMETLPAELTPPTTVVGFSVTEESTGASTSNFADVLLEPNTALIVETMFEATDTVETLKVPDVWPAAILTDAGTLATVARLLERVTVLPPAAAGPFRVTVPRELAPPVNTFGFKFTDFTIKG